MRKNRLKGFSLFEMLVVLVILIIIIGIGYHYWSGAVAAAQKTTTLSHLKQLSHCVFLYTNDNEGHLPSGYLKNQSGGINTSGQVPPPAVFPPRSQGYLHIHESHWSSQIFPYAKQKEIYTAPGFNEVGGNINHVAFTYNGLLHEYSLIQISEPASVPLFWCGLGGIALSGKAFTTPYLVKNRNVVTLEKYGSPGITGCFAAKSQLELPNSLGHGYGSFWVYNKSLPFVFLDGSARMVKSDQIGFKYDNKGIPEVVNQTNQYTNFFIPR